VQNEGTAEAGRNPLGGICGRRTGAEWDGEDNEALAKKCSDCRFRVTEPHLSFTGTELPK